MKAREFLDILKKIVTERADEAKEVLMDSKDLKESHINAGKVAAYEAVAYAIEEYTTGGQ